MGQNSQRAVGNWHHHLCEWDQVAALSCFRRNSASPTHEWDTEEFRWLSSMFTLHLLWPDTEMVFADCVLLQHPVWDSGFALRHVFLHPHLLHLLWMSRLKLGRSIDLHNVKVDMWRRHLYTTWPISRSKWSCKQCAFWKRWGKLKVMILDASWQFFKSTAKVGQMSDMKTCH